NPKEPSMRYPHHLASRIDNLAATYSRGSDELERLANRLARIGRRFAKTSPTLCRAFFFASFASMARHVACLHRLAGSIDAALDHEDASNEYLENIAQLVARAVH